MISYSTAKKVFTKFRRTLRDLTTNASVSEGSKDQAGYRDMQPGF